jgi:pantoate--beta-alanine ligase
MHILKTPREAFAKLDRVRRGGVRLGLVPTMGALHAGHLSLVEQAQRLADQTVVSIFVNPTQFGPNEDFSRYPRTFQEDVEQLESLGVEWVFAPTEQALYPPGFSSLVQPPTVAQPLEGEFRPGHYGGVATVCMKLFQIIPAEVAVFGRKDYQQVRVIEQMVEDLNVPIRIVVAPTIREADGLAMSSRNRYLSDSQRQQALGLWRALQVVAEMAADGQRQVSELERGMHSTLEASQVTRIDYARVVDARTLAPIELLDRPAVALIAAFVGQTRLIDCLMLEDG